MSLENRIKQLEEKTQPIEWHCVTLYTDEHGNLAPGRNSEAAIAFARGEHPPHVKVNVLLMEYVDTEAALKRLGLS